MQNTDYVVGLDLYAKCIRVDIPLERRSTNLLTQVTCARLKVTVGVTGVTCIRVEITLLYEVDYHKLFR